MNYTKGNWQAKEVNGALGTMPYVDIPDWPSKISVPTKDDARLISAAPDMYEALALTKELIKVARSHFPKAIHNSDRFQLELTCAAIGKALAKAEGKC